MAEYETVRRAGANARPAAHIDEGLRAHMNKVYGLMSTGMFLTGIIAYLVGNNDAMLAAIFGSLGKVKQEGKNTFHDYKSFSDEQLTGLFRDLFAEANIGLVPRSSEEGRAGRERSSGKAGHRVN